jgi:hypothetical protein
MTDRLQTLQEDISFLRDLAEGGASPRLLGGSTLVAAGSIYGVASLAHGALALGLLQGVSPWAFPWIWGGATVAFVGAMALLRRRLGAQSAGAATRAAALAWQAVGWTIFAVFACIAIVGWRTNSMAPLLLAPSLILALYGLAWMIAAGVTRQGWIWRVAICAYLAAMAAAVACLSPWVFVLFAAALVATAILPGLVLIRQAREA